MLNIRWIYSLLPCSRKEGWKGCVDVYLNSSALFFWMMAQVFRHCITVKFSLLEMLQSSEIDTNIQLTKNLLIHLPEYTLIKISSHYSFRSILWKKDHTVRRTLKLISMIAMISKGCFTKSLGLEINLWAILAQRLALSSHFASTTNCH